MRWFWQKKADEPEGKGSKDADTQRVRVFDFDTQTVSTIPAAELAPGMVQVRMDGIEGAVWVEAARLQPNPQYQHGPFPEEIRDYLRRIKAALDEVHPMSLEAWEDGFRRDRTPEREIAYWLHVADVYSRLTAPDSGMGSTPERRRTVFKILVGCGVAPKEQILSVSERGPLTREEAERVISAFYGGKPPP